jgi:ABC-type antimicrobial peptide transport system permease subunit
MLRKIVCASVVLALSIGFAFAEDIKGRITKVDGNKITVTQKGDETGKVYDVSPDVKITRNVKGEKKETTGLSSLKIGEKGVFATLTTDNSGKVTAIQVMGGKKKKE